MKGLLNFIVKTHAVRSDAGGEYQAVLGGHQIWSSGTVSYTKMLVCYKSILLSRLKTFYDFNVWDGSNSDMFVNLIPGAFASLGWAIPYITTGQISRTETIDLNCCKDEDCGDSTEFDCECNLCTAQCPWIWAISAVYCGSTQNPMSLPGLLSDVYYSRSTQDLL